MQQVNLYQPIFRKQKKVFSALALVQALVLLALALTSIYGYGRWQLLALDKALAGAKTQRATTQARLSEIQRLTPPRARDQRLVRAVESLHSQNEFKRRTLAMLEADLGGAQAGFVGQLEGLARQRVDGVWLTRLALSEGGSGIGLNGNALAPELVPRYLQRLSAEASFSGTQFRTFLLERDANQDNWVAFELSSVAKEN